MSFSPPLAQFGQSGEWMPFILGVMLFLIPIVAILTAHQRKMAEIVHRGHSQENSDEMLALRAELARLTQAVYQNTIAIDSLVQRQPLPPAPILSGEQPTGMLQGR